MAIDHGSPKHSGEVEEDSGVGSKQKHDQPRKLSEEEYRENGGAIEEATPGEPREGNQADHVPELGWWNIDKRHEQFWAEWIGKAGWEKYCGNWGED